MLGKGTLHLARRLDSWVSPPGVIYGCRLRIEPGLSVTVGRGKAVTPNSFSVEILEDVRGAVLVQPATSANRTDYVVLAATEGGAAIHYVVGHETDRPMTQLPQLLQNGVMLGKLYVTYPTLSPESVYIHNVLPARGEPIMRSLRPVTVPDGVKTAFVFPVRCAEGHSMKVRIWGISQDEGTDYEVTATELPEGPATVVTFNVALPAGTDISADIYAGSVRLIP